MVSHRTRCRSLALLGLTCTAALAGCDLGSTTIPLSEPQVVVHAILNPTLNTQTFLLEESLTGKKPQTNGFDPNNPIANTGGIPISNAVIQLTGPEGVRTAGETKVGGRGTGIYTVTGSVQPGARYTLSITAIGQTVTGSTQVPLSTPPPGTPTVPFNRDRQSVNLPISNVDLARAYWVRIEAPFAAFTVFTTDREVAISGDTRNLFTDDLLRVFFPGFQQTMTVAAVDTNLYDYYRSGNDPFSGVGLISHLSGGIGLFGSMAMVERRILDVTQDSTGDPIEATFTLRSGGGFPGSIRLYLESKAASEGGDDRISGGYVAGPAIASYRGAILGRRTGEDIKLQFYQPLSTVQENGDISGTFRGDTIRGRMAFAGTTGTANGTVLYVRQGK